MALSWRPWGQRFLTSGSLGLFLVTEGRWGHSANRLTAAASRDRCFDLTTMTQFVAQSTAFKRGPGGPMSTNTHIQDNLSILLPGPRRFSNFTAAVPGVIGARCQLCRACANCCARWDAWNTTETPFFKCHRAASEKVLPVSHRIDFLWQSSHFPFLSHSLSLSSWLSHLYPCCYHTASIWGFIGRFINLLFALLSHPNREKYKKRYKEERKGCIHQQYSYETKKAAIRAFEHVGISCHISYFCVRIHNTGWRPFQRAILLIFNQNYNYPLTLMTNLSCISPTWHHDSTYLKIIKFKTSRSNSGGVLHT